MGRDDSGAGSTAIRATALTAVALAVSWAIAFGFRFVENPLAELEWYGFGFHDERWIVLGYWLSVASVLFVPLLTVPSARDWSRPSASEPDRFPWLRMAAALLVYAAWVGPPWNLELLSRPMEWHEIVHLGPLQALMVGKPFYLESGTQYGPGMQMLSLHYLERFGVSLVRFREFWMWTNFAGGAVIVAWMARLFPVVPLLVGMLLFRFFSPFHFLRPTEGSYEFFFGWATCIRYAGAIHAVLALAWVLRRDPQPAAVASADEESAQSRERIFLLLSGLVFGMSAQISQENLGCGAIGAALLYGFAFSSGAASLPRLIAVAAPFTIGFTMAVLPILGFFASAGQLDAFVLRYFEVGAYVASGLSNTPLHDPWHSSAGWLYRLLPIGAMALFCVAALSPGLPRHSRIAAAATSIVTLVCFAPALLRTDEAHILAAALMLGMLVAAALASYRHLEAPIAKIAIAFVLIVGLGGLRPSHFDRLLHDVSARADSIVAVSAPRETVGNRVGYQYDDESGYSVFSEIPLREFLDLGRSIREKVGSRPIVIASAIGTRGHWYFFADLHPLMPDPEPSMTIVNNRLRARYLADLDRRGIPCVMSTRPQDAELVLYHAQPGPKQEWLFPTREQTVYISCTAESEGLAFSYR